MHCKATTKESVVLGLESASVSFSGFPQLLQQQRLFVVPHRAQAFSPPPPLSDAAAAASSAASSTASSSTASSSATSSPLQAADHVAQDVGVRRALVQGVALQGLLDQLLRAGARRGQDALVVGAGADLVPEDLQHPGRRALRGELGRVVRRPLRGLGRRAPVPAGVGPGFHRDPVSVTQGAVQDLGTDEQHATHVEPTLCLLHDYQKLRNKHRVEEKQLDTLESGHLK
ncbi:hypothetical protein EYF80_042939 [Liparis tanakae]|uniref:Uncharacterized protein n=1 Tax=Liparis tanakae TaxID=230148 RepID=A0A4Z2G1V5_9TELE|nr:hypothetical protein EYF80_042939 [Liparis tanakae]